MEAKIKFVTRTMAVLLVVCICASAQQEANLVYGANARRVRSYRVMLTSRLTDAQGTLYLEPGQVTIRNKSGDDIMISDHQLLDA